MHNTIKILLIFYLFQMGSLSNHTMGKQMQEYIQDNRIAKHLINFMFIFVLISVLYQNRENSDIAISTTIVYLLYLLTTKLDLQFNIVIIGLMFVFFYYYRNYENKEIRINSDTDLMKDIKENILKNDIEKYNIGTISFAVLVVILMNIYYKRKHTQYGGNFDLVNFFIY